MPDTSILRRSEDQSGVAVNNRYKWVEFETEDGEVIRCRVRTSLLNEEVERLVDIDIGGDMHALWEETYRYVEEWNLKVVVEEDGEDVYYDVLPPRAGGPETFRYAPRSLVIAIIGTLINEPFKRVDPNSSAPVESTE